MKKCNVIIPLMIILLLTSIVYGEVFIQISEDNSTWEDITTITYNGQIDEDINRAIVDYLEEGKIYYFRGYDNATNTTYGYTSTTTETVKFDEMNISIIMMVFLASIVAIGLGFLLKGFFSSDPWYGGSILLWLYSIICVYMGSNMVLELYQGGTINVMLSRFMWTTLVIFIIMFIYVLIMYVMEIWKQNLKRIQEMHHD